MSAHRTGWTRLRRVIPALGLAALVAGLVVAAPGDRTVRLISGGTTNDHAGFLAATDDGSRVWFRTAEALPGTGDTDASQDVYERTSGGALRLITTGGANVDAYFDEAAEDGSRVWFDTSEPIPGTGDADPAADLYERTADGALRLLSTSGANLPVDYRGATGDGSRVWFSTSEAIPGTGDADAAADVYERAADGALRLVTTSGANVDAQFVGAARDGSRVWFSTSEAIPGTGDADVAIDVYERAADGALRLVSTSGVNAPAYFAGGSSDGLRVRFVTAEAIPGTGDADAAMDVYERLASGALRLVTTSGANTNAVYGGATEDGLRVWFSTAEAVPGTGDTDTAQDVYERAADGGLRLISTSGAAIDAFHRAAAPDGSRVWFETTEAIAGTGDTDANRDLYERAADGTLRLISTGGAASDAFFGGATRDGGRVWFLTFEAVPGTGDTDTAADAFERAADGALRLVTGGTADTDALIRGAATDGSRVWFETLETLPGSGDADTVLDVYEVAWAVPANTAPPQVTGDARVGGALTCSDGTWAGEGFALTRAWLRDGAAIAGATGATHTVLAADAGHALACRVTAANPIGSADATSAAVNVGDGGATAVARLGGLRLRVVRVRGVRRLQAGFRLSAPGRVRLVLRRDGRAKALARTVLQGKAGSNSLRFAARLGGTRLVRGRYRVEAQVLRPGSRLVTVSLRVTRAMLR